MKLSTFSVPESVKTWTQNMIFNFSAFFHFHHRKRFFPQKIIEIIKNRPFAPEAPDPLKTKVLGKVLRPKSWKSVNLLNFVNFQLFLKNWFWVKKLIFMIFSIPYSSFTKTGPKNVVLQKSSDFSPGRKIDEIQLILIENELFLQF